MRVGFVTSAISRRAGGLFYSVSGLAKELCKETRWQVEVQSFVDKYSVDDILQWAPLVPSLHSCVGPNTVGFSPSLQRAVLRGDYDLLHTQGIWQWPSAAVHEWHVKTGRPYLISPRGMLDPWALSRSRVKKSIASRWFEAAHLRDASCLHALCRSEADSMRQYGLRNPICVIPNGVELPRSMEDGAGQHVMADRFRTEGNIKTLLYISRLHPKKGLPEALRAWAGVCSPHAGSEQPRWRFVIAGWDQQEHQAELQNLCAELGIEHRTIVASQFLAEDEAGHSPGSVTFVGPAYGGLKDELLRRASAFILPSYSEGLPMAVLEAWAYRLPVLMTDQCNLPEGFAADAAIRIDTDADSIVAGLQRLVTASDSQCHLWGENGRQLAETRFNWSRLAAQMADVYRWVSGDGPKPGCVLVD